MNILVACEESQVVCKAFRDKGHLAFSCDLQMCSGGHLDWHIKGDVLPLLEYSRNVSFTTVNGQHHKLSGFWDMVIAHPPCTYLAKSGSFNFGRPGQEHREEYMKSAAEFFMIFYNLNVPKICIENPVPMKRAGLPKHSQVIYPELFGANYTKQTLLWLKGLPPLIAPFTDCEDKYPSLCAVKRCAKARSKTFEEVAKAMSDQWG